MVPPGPWPASELGSQDAIHPQEGESVDVRDCQSLLGHVIMRMGGPLVWGCTRKRETMSQSSCESEIYSLNEGTKSILNIQTCWPISNTLKLLSQPSSTMITGGQWTGAKDAPCPRNYDT